MKRENRKLVLEQLDRKLRDFQPLGGAIVPERGWLHAIRTALGMSLRQLGGRLGISTQSVKEIEDREADASITLKTLREAAKALDLELVYVLIPKAESLEAMIEKRAIMVARSIVLRTSMSMELEDQEVSSVRIEKAVRSKAEELVRMMPRYLWD
ncbi:MAG: mobile mystery protein A [Ignavibacteriae bacterium]|nr:mobile mystery protein A [Ignavibacteriota bacterium]